MKICTFNLQGRRGGQAYVKHTIGADLALLQETKAAHWPTPHMAAQQTDGRKRLGATGIWARAATIEPLALPRPAAPSGTLTAASVRRPHGGTITAISVYALIQKSAHMTAELLVDDVATILKNTEDDHVILGGDFNAWDQYGGPWRARWQEIWAQLETLGLINLMARTRDRRTPPDWCRCGLGGDCWHVQTVRRSSRAHTDYLWASPALADRLRQLTVTAIDDPALVATSDHAPVVADFDF